MNVSCGGKTMEMEWSLLVQKETTSMMQGTKQKKAGDWIFNAIARDGWGNEYASRERDRAISSYPNISRIIETMKLRSPDLA